MSTVSVLNTDAQLNAKTLALIGSANSGNLLFTDATYDIGQSGATRPRDLFLSRNLTVGGTMSVAGMTLTGDLLFTDASFDIGKSGATRPRDGFFSRNVVIGGTLTVTGALTATAFSRTVFWANTAAATIPQATTTYMGPHGANTAESSMRFVIPFAGTLRNLYVRSDGSPAAGQTFTYAIMLNGGASALTCVTSDAAIASNDTTHSVAVVAGDTVEVRLITSATASARGHSAAFEIQS